MTDEYTPYRIMKSFVVPGPNEKYLMTHFPGGKIKRVGKKRGWQSIYAFKSVVNSPTPAELGLFKASKHARLIPQDPGGFDVRDSNLARSIKSSVEGRRKHLLVAAKRKFAAEEEVRKVELEKQEISAPKPKAKPKWLPEPAPKPVKEKVVEIPKLQIEPLPVIKTDSEGLAGTGMPLISGTVVKLETESETKEFKVKRKKRKYKKYSDSDPNKTDDENPDSTSKKRLVKKITEEN